MRLMGVELKKSLRSGLAMRGWRFKQTGSPDAQELDTAISRTKTSQGKGTQAEAAESDSELYRFKTGQRQIEVVEAEGVISVLSLSWTG